MGIIGEITGDNAIGLDPLCTLCDQCVFEVRHFELHGIQDISFSYVCNIQDVT